MEESDAYSERSLGSLYSSTIEISCLKHYNSHNLKDKNKKEGGISENSMSLKYHNAEQIIVESE